MQQEQRPSMMVSRRTTTLGLFSVSGRAICRIECKESSALHARTEDSELERAHGNCTAPEPKREREDCQQTRSARSYPTAPANPP